MGDPSDGGGCDGGGGGGGECPPSRGVGATGEGPLVVDTLPAEVGDELPAVSASMAREAGGSSGGGGDEDVGSVSGELRSVSVMPRVPLWRGAAPTPLGRAVPSRRFACCSVFPTSPTAAKPPAAVTRTAALPPAAALLTAALPPALAVAPAFLTAPTVAPTRWPAPTPAEGAPCVSASSSLRMAACSSRVSCSTSFFLSASLRESTSAIDESSSRCCRSRTRARAAASRCALERRWCSSGARHTANDSSGVRGAAAEKTCSNSAPMDSLLRSEGGEGGSPSVSLSPRSEAKLRLKLRLRLLPISGSSASSSSGSPKPKPCPKGEGVGGGGGGVGVWWVGSVEVAGAGWEQEAAGAQSRARRLRRMVRACGGGGASVGRQAAQGSRRRGAAQGRRRGRACEPLSPSSEVAGVAAASMRAVSP